MSIPIWCAWYAAGDVTVPRLVVQESACLVILAATLVVYRTFRERYLLPWILGWVAYLSSSLLRDGIGERALGRFSPAASQAAFVAAVCLFVAAILLYSHAEKFLRGLCAAGVLVAGLSASARLLAPDIAPVHMAIDIAWRSIALFGAVQLIRYRWARAEVGPWLFAVSLLLLHFEGDWLATWLPASAPLGMAVFLGLSMVLIVFDDSRMRTRRLAVINTLTDSMTREQQSGPMLVTALEELKQLMGAKAAWFRLLEGDRMILVQQIGLSREFLQERMSVPKDDGFERTLGGGVPLAVKIRSTDAAARPHLNKERFHHCVLVPVLGKKSIIGTLTLGSGRHVRYTPEEMDFLATTAHQLGLAVENLRLLEQILRSHRQWTNTFDSIQDVVLLHDADFRLMKVNRALLTRLGKAPGEVVGKTCEQTLPGSGWTGCPYCNGEEAFFEGPDPCFSGISMVSTSSYMDQDSRQKGTIHVVRDVTDRHVAEEKYRLLFQEMQEGVFVATPDGTLLDCNDAFVRMLGMSSREELMALNLDHDVYASPERREIFRREVELHNYVRNFEVQLRRKDGSLLSATESSFATRNSKGKIERYQGFLLDVSEKKLAEDEIRRRNRELNALNTMAVIASQSFDLDEILNLTLRQVISLLGAETGSIYVTDSRQTVFRRRADWGHSSSEVGRSAEVEFPGGFGELVTRSRTEVLTPEYLPHLPPALADFVAEGGHRSWIWVLLWGTERPLGMMSVSREQGKKYSATDENLLVATARQLATTIEKVRLYEETSRAYEDLRRTQEQLLQSEKMSAVGQLIAGVAHELNNPLTAILGYAQLLESEDLGQRASDFVGKLFKQAQRTHRVVQNLLSFARQRKPHRHNVDICKVLDETLALREYDLRVHAIQLEKEIETPLPYVTADPHQLEQVFLNIINNAVDAMLENGKGGKLCVHVFASEGKVHAEFQDSGPGIKEPNRIFDPFYTTKSVGKGTGLGLSICYGIIKEHGGDISARNGLDGGAVIDIRLPSAGLTVMMDKNQPAARHELAIEGRILLVEDEDAVLEFERDVLTGAGAQVETATEMEVALQKLAHGSFDAVISNGRMPGGWGAVELSNWLAERSPQLQGHVLFTFAGVADSSTRAFLQQNQVPSLVKPFEVADLISQARRILQKAHAAAAQ